MKIEWLCSDGSPIGITSKDLWGEGKRGVGVGGSEYLMVTLCELWTEQGHDVIVYNDPLEQDASPYEQRPKACFDPTDKRDVLITFRSPNPQAIVANGKKVWLSCDQYTLGSFDKFAPFMDKIVVISEFHKQYFASRYRINDTIVIDIPVRAHDFEDCKAQKVPKRLIFTSVPDRGLDYLRAVWPKIKINVPDASLVITSDYRLWGLNSPKDHRVKWIRQEGINYIGAVPRKRLIQEQLQAEILAYPNVYDELFCVAVAEAQFAGAYPITSGIGALSTTNMGTIIPGDPRDGVFLPRFADEIIRLLNSPEELQEKQKQVRQMAAERFSPERILEQWDKEVFA